MYMNGSTIHAASSRVAHRNTTELIPITSSASISSEIRIAPISATSPVPTFADIMYPNAYGMISRRSHQAANTPAFEGAPTERLKYAPSMPHCRPRMKASPQITSAEPRIRMPAWRSASPKKWNTRPLNTSATTRAENLAMSPNEAIQSLGTDSQVRPITQRARGACECSLSLDHRDLGVGGEQGLGEDVVEREDAQELDHHALVHGSTHPFGASGGGHPLVTGDDRDDRAEQGGLHHRSPQVGGTRVVQQRGEEGPERRVEGQGGQDPAEDAEDQRV